ncbi:hypothetical protein CC85DRAFT_285955 [Cutaneotrichosporon oleaginosum]|uniref:Uncharacterized protein n=1 Tax=Cutaneotrichosporon oleaginosum TaxID=879819 RepID=A0A0J0XLQ3_9TREE|nr:uncharacterized protein CC85DRAFT_285955 [Cutaneotrichosporon oleaginosum]KLT42025.1 hypothetical protein CC85DRAFT_285955 [Cutaneotrichosporon oleaginosum]TXT14319.1 hypothetical protein COLE_00512 [Cutaneotrichosporon oleaginosum]
MILTILAATPAHTRAPVSVAPLEFAIVAAAVLGCTWVLTRAREAQPDVEAAYPKT